MQWLIAVTMGLWAVWTWSQQREQERLTERARLAALYVNPFMSACEDLQSRIYNILELGGLFAELLLEVLVVCLQVFVGIPPGLFREPACVSAFLERTGEILVCLTQSFHSMFMRGGHLRVCCPE